MIKLIASDLDGTLLNDKKQLPDGFFDFLDTLSQNGLSFAAASGRQYYSVEEVFAPVRDKMLFIAENGGIAFDGGKMIYSHPLDNSDILRIAETIDGLYRKGVRMELSGENAVYLFGNDTEFIDRVKVFCGKGRVKVVNSWQEALSLDKIIKIAIYDEDAENRSYPLLKELEPNLNVILSAAVWVDVVGGDVSKGRSLRELMAYVGADYDETMAFGDYLNDYEMIKQCKYGFAVENAHADLKKAAAYIAPSNNDNGVIKSICKIAGIEYPQAQ